MKWLLKSIAGVALASAAWMAGLPSALAYPPAPHHEFYGVIRDAFGNALDTPAAKVLLETDAGVTIEASVVPGREDGFNYLLTVPMDAGLTSESYRRTALRPLVPFTIRVEIGRSRYVPMEMTGDFARLGRPGERTRLDLTLGEDSDGDGLPDAWELALIDSMGQAWGLGDVRPGDDLDGDGLNNRAEYLAGTYADDRDQTFLLNVVGIASETVALEFLAVAGRTYAIESGDSLGDWLPVLFRVPGSASPVRGYRAGDTRVVRVEVAVSPESGETADAPGRFFRLSVR